MIPATGRAATTLADQASASRTGAPEPRERLSKDSRPSPSRPPAAARKAESAAADEEIPRDLLRDLLRQTIDEKLPDRELSPGDVERLTDAVLRIRAARRALGLLPVTARNASDIRRWQEKLSSALSDFQTVAGMSAAEFTRLAEPGVGLTEGEDHGGVVHEPLSDYPPPE